MAGEYKFPSGDIYGEPDAIYAVSNSDEQTTIDARTQANYTNPEVDEYMGELTTTPDNLMEMVMESIKKVLKEEYVKMKATDKVEQVIAYMLADSLAQGKQIKKVIKVEDLQGVLDETNSSMYYNGKFFNNVEDAGLQPYYNSFNQGTIYDIGGGYYTEPQVTIVPKGTKVEYGRFVLPK